jgi:hypothetical protein
MKNFIFLIVFVCFNLSIAQTVPVGNRGGGGGLPKPPSVPDLMKKIPKNLPDRERNLLIGNFVEIESQFLDLKMKINHFQKENNKASLELETIIDLFNILVMQETQKKTCCGHRDFLTTEVKNKLKEIVNNDYFKAYGQYRLMLKPEQVDLMKIYFLEICKDG